MSMSTYVVGFRPPDETWTKMKAIWDACQAAGIEVPNEVDRFFDGQDPDPHGLEVELPIQPWQNGGSEGYELKVADIPPAITVIRFYNSW